MEKWFLTEEWDEGQKERVTAYGLLSEEKIQKINYEMKRYSPYEYAVGQEFEQKEKYESYLRVLWESRITDNIYYVNEKTN